MPRLFPRSLLALFLVFATTWSLGAVGPARAPATAKIQPVILPDLSEFRTVTSAVTTRLAQAGPAQVGQSGYLGVHVTSGGVGKLVVADVEADSPAARAGL